MKLHVCYILLIIISLGCKSSPPPSLQPGNPLSEILQQPKLQPVIKKYRDYEVQIIYTQIDRNKDQQPQFTSWYWNVDSTRYFYPASMVKMPLALLSLEKLNNIRSSGFPRMNTDTWYLLDSLRPHQHEYKTDALAPGGKPSIGQDVRAIFAVSDNQAYNHLFEFLGRTYINESLAKHAYTRTGLQHRFYAADRDQRYAQPMTFFDANGGVFKEKEKIDEVQWVNPQQKLSKGKGFVDNSGATIKKPFDFSSKNWFALTDMELMLRAALFPKDVPKAHRFKISTDDYKLLHRSMGLFPREFDYPKYTPAEYWDGYVKFFVFGDTKAQQNGSIRIFNKVGEAYGTLTDVAYIVDFEHHTEFILAATILCNSDGIFNDDKYDYDSVGFPFLAELGRAVLEYDKKRARKVTPDLSYWQNIVK